MGDVNELGKNAVENILSHAGVKGMRWGVRRSKKELDRAAGRAPSKKDDGDSKMPKAKRDKKTNINELSDQELRQKLNRLQMEKQYKELTKAPPGVAAAGKKFAAQVLQGIAKQTAQNLGQSYASKYTEQFMAGAKKGNAPILPPRQGPLRPPG